MRAACHRVARVDRARDAVVALNRGAGAVAVLARLVLCAGILIVAVAAREIGVGARPRLGDTGVTRAEVEIVASYLCGHAFELAVDLLALGRLHAGVVYRLRARGAYGCGLDDAASLGVGVLGRRVAHRVEWVHTRVSTNAGGVGRFLLEDTAFNG